MFSAVVTVANCDRFGCYKLQRDINQPTAIMEYVFMLFPNVATSEVKKKLHLLRAGLFQDSKPAILDVSWWSKRISNQYTERGNALGSCSFAAVPL